MDAPRSESEPLLSLADLRLALAECELGFSDSQLKRLRREGLLLVRGQQQRAGLRGSESLYPAWSIRQLELIDRLARQERRFVRLRVLVRWHGGWVRPDALRASLIDLLAAMSAMARDMTAGSVSEDDRADRLVQALIGRPGRSGATRLMRRRLNNVADDIERTMFVIAALGTDSPLEWENHDPENPTESLLSVFERASGMDRAQHDDIGGNGPLMSGRESSRQILEDLQRAGAFRLLDLGAAFSDASDEAIGRAFDDAIAFAGLADVFDAIQTIGGEDIAGLGSVTELGRAQDAVELALLVRGLLLLRPLMAEGALEGIVQAARDAEPKLRAASEICRALPQHAALLGPGGAEQLAALPAAERDRVVGEIRAYLKTRPELAEPSAQAGDRAELDASPTRG